MQGEAIGRAAGSGLIALNKSEEDFLPQADDLSSILTLADDISIGSAVAKA